MIRTIAAALAIASLAACGSTTSTHLTRREPPKVTPATLKKIERLRTARAPAYYLGTTYRGLTLIHVEVGEFFPSSLTYADCTSLELNSMSLFCHHVIEVDNDLPAAGEITTQGRCRYKGTIRGVTVATFAVNPHDLRIFTRDATVHVSANTLEQTLSAARQLHALNRPIRPTDRLPARNVSSLIGTCRAPKPAARRPPLSPKQRYESRMRRSFLIETIGTETIPVTPSAAKPTAVARSYLANTANIPSLLRNEAARIDKIRPPPDVADAQGRLVSELRTYADDVDQARKAVSEGDWNDGPRWATEKQKLESRMASDSAMLDRTVRAFAGHGYRIYVTPRD